MRQRARFVRRGRSRVRVGELAGLQARAFRALILGEANAYPAFRFRW